MSNSTVPEPLGDRVAKQTTRSSNISQNIIEVSEDKLKLCLIEYEKTHSLRTSWHTPLCLLISLLICIGTTSPKEAIGIPADTWLSFFMMGATLSALWFIRSLRMARMSKKISIENLIANIKAEQDRNRAGPEPTQQPQFEPSYPVDRWEFSWFRYTGVIEKPWGDFISLSYKNEIDFDDNWKKGIVSNSGLSNNVAFKASRTLPLDAGRYTFLIGADDGIKLYVYNNDFTETYVEMDEWRDQTWSEFRHIPVDLPAGDYKILIEWYERYGAARARFNIAKEGSK